jgi:hypothetical protein
MSTVTMQEDNLQVVDKPIMSTRAIVFIAIASASAAFSLGIGIWCLFYGTFGRGLKQRRAREDRARVRLPPPESLHIQSTIASNINSDQLYQRLPRPTPTVRPYLKKPPRLPIDQVNSVFHGSMPQEGDHHTRRLLPTCLPSLLAHPQSIL